jgi:hypothetical protein
MAGWEGFSQCPGCGYDFATGEGERSCAWGDCPYLPEELDVFCPQCRLNFLTMEGNPALRRPADVRVLGRADVACREHVGVEGTRLASGWMTVVSNRCSVSTSPIARSISPVTPYLNAAGRS